MQKSTIKGLAASALVLGLLAAVQTASAAPQGIRNTRHNLGTGGSLAVGASNGARNAGAMTGMGDVFTTATSEICVFCHTPHGANLAVPVPLWNKGVSNTTYTVFSSGTMGGNGNANAAPSNLAGHMSIACLSCHDGTQAMDNMINQPGQGGYNANGLRLGTDVGNLNTAGVGSWYFGNNAAIGTAPGGKDNVTGGDVFQGKMTADAGIDFIGTDLSNDHPIGMKYAGGGCTTTGSTTGCNDTDFYPAQAGLNGFFQVGGTDLAGAKTAMRLYQGATTALADATVECASCHDPHSDAQNTFLRRSNANSGVCLTCHNK